MRISGVNNILNNYNTQKVTQTDNKKKVKGKDVFDISSTAKEYQIAKKALSQNPDIREDKVQDIKRRIETGNYNINAQEIADKIVDKIFDSKA